MPCFLAVDIAESIGFSYISVQAALWKHIVGLEYERESVVVKEFLRTGQLIAQEGSGALGVFWWNIYRS